MLRMLYLHLIKKNANKLIFISYKTIINIVLLALIICLPLFLTNALAGSVNIQSTFDRTVVKFIVSLLFAYSLYSCSKPNYRRLGKLISKQYHAYFDLVPSKYPHLVLISQIEEFVKSTCTTCVLIIALSIISGKSAFSITNVIALIAALNLFVRVILIIAPAFISIMIKNETVRTLIKISAAVSTIIIVCDMFVGEIDLSLPYLPIEIFTDTISLLFHFVVTETYVVPLSILMLLVAYSGGLLIILRICGTNYIDSARIYESRILISALSKKVNKSFSKLCKLFWFLPNKLRLLVAKEIQQFFNESSNMTIVLFNAALLISILFLSQKIIPGDVVLLSSSSLMGYISFYIAVTAIARDMRYSWIMHVHYPKWGVISLSKILSSYFCSLFLNIITIPIFFLILLIVTKNVYTNFIYIYIWNNITTIPLAIGWGLIISSFANVKEKDGDEKVIYSFSGFESVFYIAIMLFISTPSLYCALSSHPLYKVLFILYEFIILSVGFFRVRSKIRYL